MMQKLLGLCWGGGLLPPWVSHRMTPAGKDLIPSAERLLILLAQYYLVAPRGLGQRYFPTWVTWVAGCWLNLGLPACNTRALRGGTSSEWHKTLPYINSRPWTLGCWQQLSRVSGSEAVSRLAHYDPQSSKGRCQELKLVLLCAKLVL